MTTEQANDTPKDVWADDRLGRKPYADFLTTYLRNRCVTEKDGAQTLTPFCISIDAKWGEGKTFFLKAWLDDLKRDEANLAFLFDAWTSEFDTDPIIAFMATFKAALDAEFKKPPTVAKLNNTLENGVDSLEKGIRKLGRAFVPTAKAVVKGLARRHVPGAMEDIAAYLESDDESAEVPQDKDKDSWSDDAAESLFKSLLEESTKRKELIKEFREHVQNTLRYLADSCGFKLPMFVFIDELDRCRPTFAVELLEGLKHVFNIPGLCFVVATNIEQLAHSVKAVYGEGFDGTAYLQRFFDVGYILPRQSPIDLLHDEIARCPILGEGRCNPGLPKNGFVDHPGIIGAHVALEWVADEFQLDPRTQKKVVEMTRAALNVIDSTEKRHAIWAFIIAAAYIKSKKLFQCIKQGSSDEEIRNEWRSLTNNIRIERHYKRHAQDRPDIVVTNSVLLIDVFFSYNRLKKLNGAKLMARISALQDGEDYMQEIQRQIFAAASSDTTNNRRLFIDGYPELIECAGHMSNP